MPRQMQPQVAGFLQAVELKLAVKRWQSSFTESLPLHISLIHHILITSDDKSSEDPQLEP